MRESNLEKIKEFVSKPMFNEGIIFNKNPLWPKISIITPAYNQGRFLERTILSILNQNYPNLEYIVIDGGSIDESIDIIKKYEKYFSYWTSERDKGQSNALNKGFLKSTGEILGWLNSDDTLLPDSLLTIGKFFKENPEIDVVYGHATFIDEEDNLIRRFLVVPFSRNAFMYVQSTLFQSSAFWKRDNFFKAGMVNENKDVAMDTDLFWRFLKDGARFRFINKTFSNMRIHDTSKTFLRVKRIKYQDPDLPESRLDLFGLNEKSVRFFLLRKVYRLRQFYYLVKMGETRYILDVILGKITGKYF